MVKNGRYCRYHKDQEIIDTKYTDVKNRCEVFESIDDRSSDYKRCENKKHSGFACYKHKGCDRFLLEWCPYHLRERIFNQVVSSKKYYDIIDNNYDRMWILIYPEKQFYLDVVPYYYGTRQKILKTATLLTYENLRVHMTDGDCDDSEELEKEIKDMRKQWISSTREELNNYLLGDVSSMVMDYVLRAKLDENIGVIRPQ